MGSLPVTKLEATVPLATSNKKPETSSAQTVPCEAVAAGAESQLADAPVIHTLELAKRYGSTVALAGLTMSVAPGEVFGFLGPNGAGKTTAVKLLVGLSQPTGGEGWVLGEPIGNVGVRRRIGYLPELFRYQDWLTGREVLSLHCRLAGIAKPDRHAHIEHALDVSGLADRGDDRVGTYSKGMQQRLGLGVALLGNPDVIFLDEPTSALDPVGRHDVREIIRQLKHRGCTVFLNSHLLTEVEQVCDRVAIVDKGRVIALGRLDELRGSARVVRVQVEGLDEPMVAGLRRFGDVELDGDSLVLRGTQADVVPEVVAELVGLGVRIYGVQAGGDTLEETFLNLLEEHHDGHPDDSLAHSA